MATKKASSPKKTSSVKKPVAANVVSESKVSKNKLTFGEKASALKPGALIAEFLGTFVLAGAVINLAGGGTTSNIAIALVLAILVVVFGAISGAHLNPAITIAQYVNRKVDGVRASVYIAAQVAGAVAVWGLMLGIFNTTLEQKVLDKTFQGYGITVEQAKEQLKAGGSTLDKWIDEQGGIDTLNKTAGVKFIDSSIAKDQEFMTFLCELIGSIVFGLGVGYAVYSKKKSQIEAGLAVGVALLAGLVIGGSAVILNPAVAAAIGGFEGVNPFGAEAMTFWWPVFTYIFATTIGMTAGFTTYRFILKDGEEA